jgi:putative lipoprotein
MIRIRVLLGLPLLVLGLVACGTTPGPSSDAPSSAVPSSDTPSTAAPSAASAGLVGTVWTVTSVKGTFVDATKPPTMDFASDGMLSGTTGCNTYSGPYTVDGSSLVVGPLIMTLVGCAGPTGNVEALFAPAIQGATAWAIDADGNLRLSGAGDILAKPAG